MSKGITRGVISSIMRGSMPSLENAHAIAKVLGVPLETLLGVESPEVPEKEKFYELVPQVKGSLSCGPGSAIPPAAVKDWLWIPKKHLPGGGDKDRYAAVKVAGESMEPLLFDGDTVVIDRTDCDLGKIRKDGIYAVWNEAQDASFVKHLDYDSAERILTLISYNHDYSRRHGVEHIRLKKVTDNPVMGRVVFSFRRWK